MLLCLSDNVLRFVSEEWKGLQAGKIKDCLSGSRSMAGTPVPQERLVPG